MSAKYATLRTVSPTPSLHVGRQTARNHNRPTTAAHLSSRVNGWCESVCDTTDWFRHHILSHKVYEKATGPVSTKKNLNTRHCEMEGAGNCLSDRLLHPHKDTDSHLRNYYWILYEGKLGVHYTSGESTSTDGILVWRKLCLAQRVLYMKLYLQMKMWYVAHILPPLPVHSQQLTTVCTLVHPAGRRPSRTCHHTTTTKRTWRLGPTRHRSEMQNTPPEPNMDA